MEGGWSNILSKSEERTSLSIQKRILLRGESVITLSKNKDMDEPHVITKMILRILRKISWYI